MKLNLYVVNDSDNVINKVMANKVAININLKRDVDISNPSIILLDGIGINYSDFNYAEIEELERFYFITNITRLNSKMIQLDMRCDVLETYKNDVLSSNARLYRNIRNGDYLNTSVDSSVNKVVVKHESNKSMTGATTILTSVGA